MSQSAVFEIVDDDVVLDGPTILPRSNPFRPLVIRDIGPWDRYRTVTNDAEAVVEALVKAGRLPEGRRLLYFDSEGDLDEIIVKNGKFAGFKAGPRDGWHV